MNLIEKLWALLVSKEIDVWHYPNKLSDPKFFYFLKTTEPWTEFGCSTLEEMIDGAYSHIDPLRKELPKPTDPKSPGTDPWYAEPCTRCGGKRDWRCDGRPQAVCYDCGYGKK